MNERPLRLGIIGMGGFALHHHDAAQLLEQQGECQLICTCDPNMADFSERQDALGFSNRGVHTFTDYLDMLDQCGDELDVVTIPTPIPLHAPMHRACVDRGIPAYLEKPPTLSYTELAEMLAVEERATKLTNVGFNFIVEPERQELKRRMTAGEFGAVKRVGIAGRWPRGTQYYARASWAGRLQLNGRLVLDSCLGNAMAHYLHNVLFWAGVDTQWSWGKLSTVSAELYRANAIEGTDTIFTKAMIAHGPEVVIAMTHACAEEHFQQEWVECENATIISNTDYSVDKYFTIQWKNGKSEIVTFDTSNIVVRNFHSYFAYLRGECDRPMTRLVDSRSFVHYNDLAYIAAGTISTIPAEAVTKITTEDGNTFTAIHNIDSIIDRFMATGAFPSEQGVAWAGQPGIATPDDLPRLESVVSAIAQSREAAIVNS